MAEAVTDLAPMAGGEVATNLDAELDTTGAAAASTAEIQSALVIAKRFPRDENQAFQSLMRTCQRKSFAEIARYNYRRGGNAIEGASVNLARAAARAWGNIRFGLTILRDDGLTMTIEGWAWDLETNSKVTAPDSFKKLIFRKQGGWVQPDERDLRELVNRRGAICIRNALLQIIPKDLIEDAEKTVVETLRADAAEDPDATRKKLLVAFDSLGVGAKDLDSYLGKPLGQATPDDLAQLRQIYGSIRDGNSKWSEYVGDQEPGYEEPKPGESPLKSAITKPKLMGKAAAQRVVKAAKEAGLANEQDFQKWCKRHFANFDIFQLPAVEEQNMLRRIKEHGLK